MAFRFLTRRLPLLALFGIGYLLARKKGVEFPGGQGHAQGRGPAADTRAAGATTRRGRDNASVRPAGREEMKNPPPNWDKVDEANDESFPASDPAAKY